MWVPRNRHSLKQCEQSRKHGTLALHLVGRQRRYCCYTCPWCSSADQSGRPGLQAARALQWELLVNGTKAGKLNLQRATTEISDNDHVFVTSSKKSRLNLLGSVLTAAGLYNTTDDGQEKLNSENLMKPFSISVQVILDVMNGGCSTPALAQMPAVYHLWSMQASTPNQQPQILNLYTGPIIWSATRLSNSWKSCHYGERGHWQSQHHACVTWWFVSTLCMKVSFQPDTGTWIFSTRFGGPGCSVLRPEQGLSAARIPVPHWRNSTPPQLDAAQVSIS